MSHREAIQVDSSALLSYCQKFEEADLQLSIKTWFLKTEGDRRKWEDYCQKDRGQSVRDKIQEEAEALSLCSEKESSQVSSLSSD